MDSKPNFPRLLKALPDASLDSGFNNLKSSSGKAGIYPLNRMKVLESIPSNNNLDFNVQSNVSASVIGLLEGQRFSGPEEQTAGKKKVNFTSGKSISVGDIQKEPAPGPGGVCKHFSSIKRLER